MFRSKLMVPALSVVCLLSSQAVFATAASASTLRMAGDAHASLKSPKLVHLTLSNASGETLQLKVGEMAMTVEPGKTVDLRVAAGTRIVNVEATKTHAAGEVLSEVSKDLSGANLRIS